MSNTNYTFAVAYIRALETNLFSDSMMNQLAACKTYEECVRFLQDKGWGNGQSSQDGDEILSAERAKIWAVVNDLSVPMGNIFRAVFPECVSQLKNSNQRIAG